MILAMEFSFSSSVGLFASSGAWNGGVRELWDFRVKITGWSEGEAECSAFG